LPQSLDEWITKVVLLARALGMGKFRIISIGWEENPGKYRGRYFQKGRD